MVTTVSVINKVVPILVRQMMSINNKRLHPSRDEMIERKCNKRLLENRDERFWEIVSKWTKSLPQTSAQDKGAPNHSPSDALRLRGAHAPRVLFAAPRRK